MKVKDIIRIANDAYPDGEVMRAYKAQEPVGDTLASFIAEELRECFGDEAEVGEYEQLSEALRLMETARDELCDVCDAFEKRLNEWDLHERFLADCKRSGCDPMDSRI